MGQKSNPNSFQLLPKTNNLFSSSFNSLEYSNFLKDYLTISSNLTSFFEKNVFFSIMLLNWPRGANFGASLRRPNWP